MNILTCQLFCSISALICLPQLDGQSCGHWPCDRWIPTVATGGLISFLFTTSAVCHLLGAVLQSFTLIFVPWCNSCCYFCSFPSIWHSIWLSITVWKWTGWFTVCTLLQYQNDMKAVHVFSNELCSRYPPYIVVLWWTNKYSDNFVVITGFSTKCTVSYTH